MIWAGAAVPWSYTTALCCGYTRTDYRHLQSCIATLLSCGGCCEVRMADRHLCRVRCVEAFEGQVKPHTVLNKLYWHVTVAKYAAKEWPRSAFLFHAVGSSHWQTDRRIGRYVPCWQKWTGETSVGGTVREKTFGGIIVSRGNVLHPCLTNLRRSD